VPGAAGDGGEVSGEGRVNAVGVFLHELHKLHEFLEGLVTKRIIVGHRERIINRVY
jgi:hypothetical protein